MPVSTTLIYSNPNTETIRSLLLPNQYWQICFNINSPEPPNWFQPGFNDSGWTAPVQPGGTLANCFGSFTGPNTVPGIWNRVTTNTNTDIVLFRHYVNVPAGNLIGASVYMWWASAIGFKANSVNTIIQTFGFPGIPLLYFHSGVWLNGNFEVADSSLNATYLVPGTTNVLAIMYNKLIPETCFDLAGCETGEFWPSGMIGGWALNLQYSTPVPPPSPPVEGKALINQATFHNDTGTNSSTTFRLQPNSGPLSVANTVAWDGTTSPINGESFGIGTPESSCYAWNGTDINFYIPQFQSGPNTGGSGLIGYPYIFDYDAAASPQFLTPSFSKIAQGFNAQWTTLKYVRVAMTAAVPFTTPPMPQSWPSNFTLTATICNDGGIGLPDESAPLGSVTVTPLTDVVSVGGPINFHFDPPITLTPFQNYFVVITAGGSATSHKTGPAVRISYNFFICNDLATTLPPFTPVIYGQASQGYQALGFPYGGILWQEVSAYTNASRPSAMGQCADPNADTAAVWNMSIGGEGLAYAFVNRVFSSTANGMGVSGFRDPNSDIILDDQTSNPDYYTSTWCIDGVTILDPTQLLPEGGDGNNSHLGLFVDETGVGWVPTLRQTEKNWGILPSNRMQWGEQAWPWPFDALKAADTNFEVKPGLSVRNPDGLFIAAWASREVYDSFNNLAVGFLNIQTLNGTDPATANYGPLFNTQLTGDPSTVFLRDPNTGHGFTAIVDHQGEAIITNMLVDGAGNTHLFYHDVGDTLTHPTTLPFAPIPFYHIFIGRDGSIGQPILFDYIDCTQQNRPIVGVGATNPINGTVQVPYSNGNACSVIVTFGTDGILIGFEEIPAEKPPRRNVWGDRYIPSMYSVFQQTAANQWTIGWVGSTQYLFAQDGVGISVAKKTAVDPVTGDIGWTGYAIYEVDTPHPPTPFDQFPSLLQTGLVCQWNDARQQLAVVWQNWGNNTWLQWFNDTGLVYGVFVPTGCPPPILVGGQIIG